MANHRTIYKQHYGPIPKDEDGRSYDIHHIDGNHNNNDPSNLKAITIQEHYDIHFSQGDWSACLRLSARMNLTAEEVSEIAGRNSRQRVENGTHHFLGDKNPNAGGKQNQRLVENGTHNLLGENNPNFGGKVSKRLLEEGTHPLLRRPDGTSHATDRIATGNHHFLDKDWQIEKTRKKMEDGTHHFLTNHPSKIKKICPYCHKEYDLANYTRWHGDNCKAKYAIYF